MRSRAHFKSHPIHPILVAFPIAFFVGAFVFDLLFLLLANEGLYQTAFYLNIAGLAMGLIAAVPGFVDYLHTVPPESSAKSRATKHALINILMMAVFAFALIYRRLEDSTIYILLAIELVGVILLSIAGWMGGTLVYRNQIGVDIRYADSGKWNEQHIEADNGRVVVAMENELQVNQMKLVHINHKRIVIARTDDGYVAFNDYCPHKGASLAGGSMMCGTVQCPWHGSQFEVCTGAVTAGPAEKTIPVYRLQIEDNKILFDTKQLQVE